MVLKLKMVEKCQFDWSLTRKFGGKTLARSILEISQKSETGMNNCNKEAIHGKLVGIQKMRMCGVTWPRIREINEENLEFGSKRMREKLRTCANQLKVFIRSQYNISHPISSLKQPV